MRVRAGSVWLSSNSGRMGGVVDKFGEGETRRVDMNVNEW